METPDWTRTAISVTDINVEVGFCISDSFYYGPENEFTEQQWCELREPLYQPRLAQYQGLILSHALQFDVTELVRYYTDVLHLSQKHQCEASEIYFWMRPILYSSENIQITFPWYDTWQETKVFLERMSTDECGEVFSDVDQSWEVTVYATSTQLFLRQINFDTGEERASIVCDRQDFVKQISVLSARIKQVLKELRSALGRDYWSRS